MWLAQRNRTHRSVLSAKGPRGANRLNLRAGAQHGKFALWRVAIECDSRDLVRQLQFDSE
jgi:hypothetical protein